VHYLKRLLLIIKENNLIYFFIFIIFLFVLGNIKIELFENITFKIIITFIGFFVLIIHCFINFNIKTKQLGRNLIKMLYWLIIGGLLESLSEWWSESFFGSALDVLSLMAFIYAAVLFFKVPWNEFEDLKKKDKKVTNEEVKG